METMQAKPVADGQQPVTSADIVCKAPSQGSGNNLFFKESQYHDKLHKNRDIGGNNASGTACY